MGTDKIIHRDLAEPTRRPLNALSVLSVVKKKRWPRVAEKLGASIPRERLHSAVLRRTADGPPRERWAIALSGGADSVALLLLLWAHWPERRSRLLALHFDHRLRGRASAGDARFCEKLCRALDVEIVVGTWDTRRADDTTKPSESEARAARHAFFTRTLRRRRVSILFTGHHREDLAETMFMRLARGSGAAGLAAPRPVHEQPALGRVHLRPLLSLDKSALTIALRDAGGAWREDASNAGVAHLRNRVRAHLLPAWRASAAEPGREALAGLALTRDLLEDDDAALEVWAERATRINSHGALALAPLRELPRAVLRRVVYRWLAQTPVRTDLNRHGFNALLDLVAARRTGARHSLGAAHFARITRTRLVCEPVAPSLR